MHKKSIEIKDSSPERPESRHSDSYHKEMKGKEIEAVWSRRASVGEDLEDMAIDLSSTSKQDNKSTLKVLPHQAELSRDSENEN